MGENSATSISTSEKPTRHVAVKDWVRNVDNLQTEAEAERAAAALLRNDTRRGRHETHIAAQWAHHHTHVHLADRISEEEKWIRLLENGVKCLEEATAQLVEEKGAAEMQIEALFRGISVLAECFLVRDRRDARDLTYDDVHTQLQKEHKLLENSKEELTDQCREAWELISEARGLSSNMRDDLKDKQNSLLIDRATLELTTGSPLIAYKPDVLKIRPSIVGYECWLQTVQSTQTAADTLTTQVTRQFEGLKLQREKMNMLYLTQVEATNYALRKRIYNANKFKNELIWQRQNTEEEMGKVQVEIDELRARAEDCEKRLKCAETRQEDRNVRPALELVRDGPHNILLEEIAQLRADLRAIKEHLNKSMCTFNQLEHLRNHLTSEIGSKELCLQLEMRTLDCRSNLLEHEPSAALDRDSVVVKMDKQIAPTALC